MCRISNIAIVLYTHVHMLTTTTTSTSQMLSDEYPAIKVLTGTFVVICQRKARPDRSNKAASQQG